MNARYTRLLTYAVLAFILGLFVGVACGLIAMAGAVPPNCSIESPYPPYNAVCNGPGYGGSCYLTYNNCTTVPGQPGTWNPRGYTPCTYMNGCDY